MEGLGYGFDRGIQPSSQRYLSRGPERLGASGDLLQAGGDRASHSRCHDRATQPRRGEYARDIVQAGASVSRSFCPSAAVSRSCPVNYQTHTTHDSVDPLGCRRDDPCSLGARSPSHRRYSLSPSFPHRAESPAQRPRPRQRSLRPEAPAHLAQLPQTRRAAPAIVAAAALKARTVCSLAADHAVASVEEMRSNAAAHAPCPSVPPP